MISEPSVVGDLHQLVLARHAFHLIEQVDHGRRVLVADVALQDCLALALANAEVDTGDHLVARVGPRGGRLPELDN